MAYTNNNKGDNLINIYATLKSESNLVIKIAYLKPFISSAQIILYTSALIHCEKKTSFYPDSFYSFHWSQFFFSATTLTWPVSSVLTVLTLRDWQVSFLA